MSNELKNMIVGITLVAAMTGCAHTRSPEQDEKTHRTRNVLIAVGSTIAVGVLLGKKAQNNVRDAIAEPSQGE